MWADALIENTRSGPVAMPVEKDAELGLEAGIGCIEHFAAGNDHNVDGPGRLVMAKELADEPFSAVSLNRRSHLAGGGNAESGGPGVPVPREHEHQSTRALEPCLIEELKLRPLPNVLGRSKSIHTPKPQA